MIRVKITGDHHGAKATSVNSCAEELFVQLFCEVFGPEKTENLQVQYPCVDIYGWHRHIDFALELPESKIAIEIDGEIYHKLTREDWLHIVDVCDKSLEKYYLRIKR